MEENNDGKVRADSQRNYTVWWIVGLSVLAVIMLLVSQFLFTGNMLNADRFYDNTKINGINVSGLTKQQAANLISTKLLSDRDSVVLTLTYKDQTWTFRGSDFELNNEIEPILEQTFNRGRKGSIFEKRKELKNIEKNGLTMQISYKNVLGGIDEKLEEIFKTIESKPVEPSIDFKPDSKEMFKVVNGTDGVEVNRNLLYEQIDKQFTDGMTANVEIPVILTPPEKTAKELLVNTELRSKFETSYATSGEERKHNIRTALKAFNGMVVKPDQEVSFNETTGPRSEENGYKKANVILNGVYVKGSGGGVCQASTTLYNALILSDLEILESNHHSLPAAYVPLAFDAMVSEGYSDLKFKNTTPYPIYIKAWGDDTTAHVEIYGKPFEVGYTVSRKADFIRVIPHGGDRIVPDEKGEYADKILYKGEYLRIKYPQEGYESNGYLQYFKDGELIGEKLLRHDIYQPQEGIIMEGVEELGEGMTLPENNVEFIGPQESSDTNKESVAKKISKVNPGEFNP